VLKKTVIFFSWSTIDHILRLSVALVVSVVVAHHLGPAQFGLYNLILSTIAIAGCFVPLAADSIVMRELLARPKDQQEILGSQAALRSLGALIAVAASLAAIFWERGGSGLLLGLVASASLMFQPFESINVWMNSELRARSMIAARLPPFMAMSALRLLLTFVGAPLVAFLATVSVEAGLVACGMIVVYRRAGKRVTRWRVTRGEMLSLVRSSWPLLFAGMSSLLYLRIDVVMLGAMVGDHEVGIYGAATRLSEAWYFVPMILVASAQPTILRLRNENYDRYLKILKFLYSTLFWLGLGISCVMSFISTPLVTLLFGQSYAAAGTVLLVHVWAGIAVFLGVATSQFLIAEDLAWISMFRTMLGLAVNIALNLVAIPHWGALGAAVATVISYFVSTFSIVFFRQSRGQILVIGDAIRPSTLLEIAQELSTSIKKYRVSRLNEQRSSS
jgi:PST family polysaccharide transporter